jgi:hypothetical protein
MTRWCGSEPSTGARRLAVASNNPCDEPAESPDLIVGDIAAKTRWGSVGDITAFSLGISSCNIGSCWVNWLGSTPDHPVTGQNMFRLENGRFEQIGQSWLFHAFITLSNTLCSTGCIATDGTHLGVRCSNTDSASFGGYQPRLGPKFEVDASSGTFPFPPTGMNLTGDAIYKRLQVHNADLDPSLNPGALYWVEVQFVARDDAAAGNLHNNASYRPIVVVGSGSFDIALTGTTVRTMPAIEAWRAIDPEVTLADAFVPGDGRFIVGSRVTSTVSGYHYEYAVQNLDSHRSAAAFSVPIPAGAAVTDVGFHDVDYHSGEPFSGTDWTATVAGGSIVWTTETYSENQNANALRWGTLYNFRFDSPVPPVGGEATLGLFRPGIPGEIAVNTVVPCHGSDDDGDSRTSACDCDDANAQVWETPGEVNASVLHQDPVIGTTLSWSAPSDPGGAATDYDVIRTTDPSDFVNAATCLPAPDPSSLTRTDPEDPSPGGLFAYLVRARNACPAGSGPLGAGAGGALRVGRSCS